jgi:acyl-CoA synthetase (AMP-forming)/AMP-acid ligase II
MLRGVIEERQLRNIRLWQRTDLVPSEMLLGGHESLVKSFSRHERHSRRVAFLLGNEPVFAFALLAAMRRGDSAILLNPTLTAVETADVLKRTTPRLIVTSAPYLSKMRQLDVGPQIDQISFDPFGNALVFDSIPRNEFLPVQDNEFVCQLTSGVSGRARIVSRTYANINAELENFSACAGISARDTYLCPVPLFHSYGLFVGLLPAFATGAACVLAPNLLPGDIFNLTRFHNPTILLGVPFLYDLLVKSAAAAECNFSCYRYLFSAGAPLTEKLASNALLKLRTMLNPLYGTTETGVLAVALERRSYLPGFVGSPLAATNIRIFRQDRSEIAMGGEGDIGIISQATGRYLDGETVNDGFNNDWFFFPGDTGFFDSDHNLYVTGRKFSFINVASQKVDPAEVESALFSSGLARDCAVVGVPRAEYGEFIRAYVVPKAGVSARELRAACREKLAPFKVPREFVLLDDLPRSATGKVLRKYLTDTSNLG